MNINVQTPPYGTKPRSAAEIAFYRQCRAWHGYLSAFAFLALIFFSATGILLNHPDWIARPSAEPETLSLQLAPADVTLALKSADPGDALSQLVGKKVALRGAYSSADVGDTQALLRFEGIKGNSDVNVDLKTGATEISIKTSDAATILDDLHRGKNAGAAWRAIIDFAGMLALLLSEIGRAHV